MSPVSSSLNTLRRSAAVAIWMVLTLLIALDTSEIPDSAKACLLPFVSISSSVALLLLVGTPPKNERSFNWQRFVGVAVSIIIPLAWALQLGVQNSNHAAPLFALLIVFPFASVSITANDYFASHFPVADSGRAKLPLNREVASPVDSTARREPRPPELVPSLEFHSSIPSVFDGPDLDQELESDITQWLKRKSTSEGEVIEGGVRVDFADGQRDATLHVSFCPPFQSVPELTTEDLDGADLEIKVAATFAFGARLNIRRPASSNRDQRKTPTQSYRIGFVALAAPVRKVA